MGYCPIPRLGHNIADCIVTQQAWARRGWAMIRSGFGHYTVEHAPRYGSQCAPYDPARARVALLVEYVAIQRLYPDLGQHCVAIGALIQAAIRSRMRHDTALCVRNMVRHGVRQETRVAIQKLYRDRGRRQQRTRQGTPATLSGGGQDTALFAPRHSAQRGCAGCLGAVRAPMHPGWVQGVHLVHSTQF